MQKVVRVLSLKEQTAAEMKRAKTGARVNDEKQSFGGNCRIGLDWGVREKKSVLTKDERH